MCPDIMSTGFSGAERGKVKIGDSVAIFAQGPIGLCATAGAKLSGAGLILVVDCHEQRLKMSKHVGADVTINFKEKDPIQAIMEATFQSCLRVLKPGGTLSSLGVYSKDVQIPLSAFYAGLGDQKIITTLCPGGKERMRRLMDVISMRRVDLKPMVTHKFKLGQILDAYDLFSNQRDGVLKVAITN